MAESESRSTLGMELSSPRYQDCGHTGEREREKREGGRERKTNIKQTYQIIDLPKKQNNNNNNSKNYFKKQKKTEPRIFS